MKRMTTFILVALGFGLGHLTLGTHLYVLAQDPNCVQEVYDPNTLPAAIDPTVVDGLLLPPIPGVSTWEVDVGKFNRTGKACDPEGHAFDVALVSGTSPATITVDVANQTWTVATESLPGVNVVVVEATDTYGAAQRFTICWLGTGNQAPVLY